MASVDLLSVLVCMDTVKIWQVLICLVCWSAWIQSRYGKC